jgi:prephenate dehydrogenase
MLERIGARILVMPPAGHDRVVAFTSHLPQLASTALAVVLAEHVNMDDHGLVAGPGAIDSTRLALSPFDVWRDILSTNSGNIAGALDSYIAALEDLRHKLRHPDTCAAFGKAQEFARRLRELHR